MGISAGISGILAGNIERTNDKNILFVEQTIDLASLSQPLAEVAVTDTTSITPVEFPNLAY
ncbi:MAG: hypothetical protein LBP87_09325 [Planctomycetaceae bacterium]|nr:hypothetical protein [Planctomycetaceae bacterium]